MVLGFRMCHHTPHHGQPVLPTTIPTEEAFRKALFQVSTIHTSCGLVTDDYTLWPQFTWLLLIFAILAGGCTGSTAGGIKNMRIMILFHAIKNQFKRLIHPNAILPVRINKHVVPLPLLNTVTTFHAFLSVMWLCRMFPAYFFGIDFLEALTSSSLSAMGNTGLGFGYYGPSLHHEQHARRCQWIMSFLMLIGRLELFSVLILFSPVFWKEW